MLERQDIIVMIIRLPTGFREYSTRLEVETLSSAERKKEKASMKVFVFDKLITSSEFQSTLVGNELRYNRLNILKEVWEMKKKIRYQYSDVPNFKHTGWLHRAPNSRSSVIKFNGPNVIVEINQNWRKFLSHIYQKQRQKLLMSKKADIIRTHSYIKNARWNYVIHNFAIMYRNREKISPFLETN